MVKITEELVRKKSEHNEGVIGSLEELSLHQEDVEKIENVNNWCKNLEILYLQANLISKIENLNKLKKLKYLNLALNNIEVIENLERCESLEKLDLTLNFIGVITSVQTLKRNRNLKDLYLTGNPCGDFVGYRSYTIANLPQLRSLDNTEVTRSERIQAFQTLHDIEHKILADQTKYETVRNEQRERLKHVDYDVPDDVFWKSSSENAPETRVEISRRSRAIRKKDDKDEVKEKVSVSCFARNGRPLNVNQAKLEFRFHDENPEEFVLDLAVYKYLDTNLIAVDVQPIYVKAVVKGKVFQFVLPEEIHTDRSKAQRSQTTGHLVITMPRVGYKKIKCSKDEDDDECFKKEIKRIEYLEVQGRDESMDFSKITENRRRKIDFVDNPDVPPLEYS